MRRVLVLGVGALVFSALSAEAQSTGDRRPYIPDGDLQVADNVKSCDRSPGLRFYEHTYQRDMVAD